MYELAEERYNELNKICSGIEKRLQKYPEGKLHVIRNKGRIQYYIRGRGDTHEKYLSKTDDKKIEQYVRKKYDEDTYRYLNQEKKNLKKFLSKSRADSAKIQNIYSKNAEEIKNRINPIDISDEEFVKEWLSEAYAGKEIGPDVPTYITVNREHVRSKSELNIANALFRMGIPYKYESPLVLANGQTIHPDFTVLNVRKRKVYYWEHRGMMDSKDYSCHTVQRFKLMEKQGFFPGDELIFTEETSVTPLGTDEIEMIIKHYLL